MEVEDLTLKKPSLPPRIEDPRDFRLFPLVPAIFRSLPDCWNWIPLHGSGVFHVGTGVFRCIPLCSVVFRGIPPHSVEFPHLSKPYVPALALTSSRLMAVPNRPNTVSPSTPFQVSTSSAVSFAIRPPAEKTSALKSAVEGGLALVALRAYRLRCFNALLGGFGG